MSLALNLLTTWLFIQLRNIPCSYLKSLTSEVPVPHYLPQTWDKCPSSPTERKEPSEETTGKSTDCYLVTKCSGTLYMKSFKPHKQTQFMKINTRYNTEFANVSVFNLRYFFMYFLHFCSLQCVFVKTCVLLIFVCMCVCVLFPDKIKYWHNKSIIN